MKISQTPKLIFATMCLLALVGQFTGCGEVLKKPVSEPFYGRVEPPAAQEFRWSNGNLPKSFDPAQAAGAPETDIIRAVYEGLTDWDGKTLESVPAIAAGWASSDDFRTWTFQLRPNARWTNNEKITAADFVRSWRRVVEQGEKASHHKLFENIVGAQHVRDTIHEAENPDVAQPTIENPSEPELLAADKKNGKNLKPKTENAEYWFGVEAAGEFTLRVYLIEPDKDFPKLVAHPAFRPVYQTDTDFEKIENGVKLTTSGAFKISAADKNGIVLERSKNYWNSSQVKLERIRFVPVKDAESALAAYEAGEVDVVTNANLEPLAVKLLASYQDLKRTPFNAVTFYEFNAKKPQLSDRRIREAMALAIDRERLANDEMDGTVNPAVSFTPGSTKQSFKFEPEKAKKMLADAGFPNAQNFPKLRLLINRNDLQRRLAKSIAAMWRKNLGIEVEVVASSFDELENARLQGDFDLIKRSVVLPTMDETANFTAVLRHEEVHLLETETQANAEENKPEAAPAPENSVNSTRRDPQIIELPSKRMTGDDQPFGHPMFDVNAKVAASPDAENAQSNLISSEAEALDALPAIPLYFPSSYALIKPYIKGFEPNLLEAPSLKDVHIETGWQQPNTPK